MKVFLNGQPWVQCSRVACRVCMVTDFKANYNWDLEAEGCCGAGVREVVFLLPLPLVL